MTGREERADADLAASVARYYDTAIFEAELARLTRDCPVERAITLRWLERLAPANAEVAEIGVGGGVYSEYLARKGCRLRLVDVSGRLLDAAAEAEAWLDLIEHTGQTAEGLGVSDHFLYVGRRAAAGLKPRAG